MSFRFRVNQFYLSSKNSRRSLFPYLIITLLVLIIYFPTFSGGFILDDNPLIKNNPYLEKFRSLTSYLSQEDGITDRSDSGNYHTGYYRPLINLTYWLDYKFWGMKAPGFRTTNVVLHLLSCFVLLKLLVILVNSRQAAFWCTIIFAVHPVNTESVSWIASRNNILVTLFVLSSLYFYITGWERHKYISMIFSAFFFILSVLSKEFGLMLLPLFFIYQRLLSKKRRTVFQELNSYLPFVIVAIFYFILRKGVTGSLLTPSGIEGLCSRLYFAPYLIIRNLQLVFFPYDLHSFSLSYPSTYLDGFVVISILLFLLIGVGLWFFKKNILLLFSGLSFLVVIFPVLNIIPTSAVSLISMRWLYLPMALLMIGIAWIFQKVFARQRLWAVVLLCVIISYLGTYSFILNKKLWHDEDVFFQQEVLHFNNLLYAGGLAEKLLDKGEYSLAEKYFQIAIGEEPYEVNNYINYSALLIEVDRLNDALIYLDKSKSLEMTHKDQGEWFNNMGMIKFKFNDYDEAINNFLKATFFYPDEPMFWANLGGAYGSIGSYNKSIDALKKGVESSPGSIQLRQNLAVTYIFMEEYENAVMVLEEIPANDKNGNRDIEGLLKNARSKLLIKTD